MPGGIQPGTCATSTSSKLSEYRHIDLVSEVVLELGPDWEIRKSLSIEEIMGYPGEYSRLSNGKSQRWDADGGFLFYKKELVGVCENKWQDARQNACERVCKYLTFLKGSQMFISCEGPGFFREDRGGSTGPLIDMLRYAGATVLENVSDRTEYKRLLRNWMQGLVPS